MRLVSAFWTIGELESLVGAGKSKPSNGQFVACATGGGIAATK